MKHLAAKELHIRVGGDQNWAQSRVNIGLARAPKIYIYFLLFSLTKAVEHFKVIVPE